MNTTNNPSWTDTTTEEPPEPPFGQTGSGSPFGDTPPADNVDSPFSDTPDDHNEDWAAPAKAAMNLEEAVEGEGAALKSLWLKTTAKSVTVFKIVGVEMRTGGRFPPKGRDKWAQFSCETDTGEPFLLELKSTTMYQIFRDLRAKMGITDVTGIWWRLEVLTPSQQGSMDIPELRLDAALPDGNRGSVTILRDPLKGDS